MLLSIAWRNLWRNKTRSIVIILSVVFGIWAGTVVASIYYGMMQQKLNTSIKEETAHLQIHNSQFNLEDNQWSFIPNPKDLYLFLNAKKEVKAFTPRLNVSAMIANARGGRGIKIIGVNPEMENKVSGISSRISEGDFLSKEKHNHILVGKRLADKMKLKLKSKVVLTFQDAGSNLISGAFKIAGIYSATSSIQEEYNAYVLDDDLRSLINISDSINEIAIMVNNTTDLNQTTNTLQNKFPQLKTETWREVSPETGLIVETSDIASLIIVAIILLALTFGIINTMLMAILERTREIGMMFALGMNKTRMFLMVVYETVLLVFTGVPIGFLFAYAFINYFKKHGINLTSISGEALSRFGYRSIIYTDLPLRSYVNVLILVSIAAILSAIIPALKAMKLNPAETIKI